MSIFDQSYYTLTKSQMSRMGIWPEQSRSERIIRPLTVFTIAMTLGGPMLIRLRESLRDMGAIIHDFPLLMSGAGMFMILLRYLQHFDDVKLSFKNIERHWKMFKNTSAVIVLDRYAKCGRNITIVYSMYVYIELILYWTLCLSPVILDFVHPLNESRPKIYIFQADYGIDKDKYFWFILVHQYVVSMVVIAMLVALELMYFLLAVHACALFEIVGFNLKLVTSKDPTNEEKAITPRNDWNYRQIRNCITVHKEAISFANLMESISCELFGIVVGSNAIIIVLAGVQALIHLHDPYELMQFTTFIIILVFHLYINTIPGQELINHSQKIHTTAYYLDWQDMPVKAQKLLILILIRSNKPCHLTARKVYVLSMESFGSTIRTVISYLTVFAQLI